MNENDIKRRFRGMEIEMDNLRIEQHLLPDGESISDLPSKNLEYFKKYGFKVSEIFSALYEKAGGIKSDKYIPASLYMYYINPYLVNLNLSMAYVDKNAYCKLFPDVKQPETIIHNINSKFISPCGAKQLRKEEVINLLFNQKKFIIKPAIESGKGRDVTLIDRFLSKEEIVELLQKYDSDYIIQKTVKQHPNLNLLNPTSLNTARVYTYLPVGKTEYVVLGSAVRFGGPGAYRDNACTGGGLCKIHEDGLIDDKICMYKFWGRKSLFKEKNIKNLKFPSFNEVINLCLKLHKRLPYMDLIGWDIAVDFKGDPVLIELNQYPDCELIQLVNGPMFGEYTDDLLNAIKDNSTKYLSVAKRSFPHLSSHHEYNFEIGKVFTI